MPGNELDNAIERAEEGVRVACRERFGSDWENHETRRVFVRAALIAFFRALADELESKKVG